LSENGFALPQLFKGIALFTPGGDLIYGIDISKQVHWHLNLCVGLQKLLDLPEPPHFLIPAYTATIDRYFDRRTKQVKTVGEISPLVKKYESLLNVLFETEGLVWRSSTWHEETHDPLLLETYRQQFPQLWERQDLLVRLDSGDLLENNFAIDGNANHNAENVMSLSASPIILPPPKQLSNGYVLRLFVSGNDRATERTLQTIHQLLEREFVHPYTLKIIDIRKNPEQAEIDRIATTPTLIRIYPQPVRKIVGELEDLPRVLQVLTS
jgi:circadian clock protein KaiB